MKKRGFYQPVAKYEKQANISTRTSAKLSSVLKENKGKKKKQQNLTFISELYERKTDTDSTNKTKFKSMKEKLPIRLNKYPLPCNRFRLSIISVFIRYADWLS